MYQAAKEVVYNTKDCNTQRRCYGYLWTKIRTPNFMKQKLQAKVE